MSNHTACPITSWMSQGRKPLSTPTTHQQLISATKLTLNGFRVLDVCRDLTRCMAMTDNASKQRACYLIIELLSRPHPQPPLQSSPTTQLIVDRIVDIIISAAMKQWFTSLDANPWLIRVARCIQDVYHCVKQHNDIIVSCCEATLTVMMQPTRQIAADLPRPSLELLHLVTLNASSLSDPRLAVILDKVITPEAKRLFGALAGAVSKKDAKAAISIVTIIMQPLHVSVADFAQQGGNHQQLNPAVVHLWDMARTLASHSESRVIESLCTMYHSAWTKKSQETRAGILITAFLLLSSSSSSSPEGATIIDIPEPDSMRLDRVMHQIRSNVDTIVQDIYHTSASAPQQKRLMTGKRRTKKASAAELDASLLKSNLDYLKYYTTLVSTSE